MRALGILRKGLCLGLLLNLVLAASALAQKALTWQEVRDRFEALNPTLRAGLIGIDESKASEITAYLRPNPNLAVTTEDRKSTRLNSSHDQISYAVFCLKKKKKKNKEILTT